MGVYCRAERENQREGWKERQTLQLPVAQRCLIGEAAMTDGVMAGDKLAERP